ncbi:MAG: hypothetical protein LC650_01015 [Actinobacteria bacterium]|nr:hypothetical protein [Actinomycetota bacterium]
MSESEYNYPVHFYPALVDEEPEEVEPDVEVARTRAVIGNYVYEGVKYPPRAVVTVRPELAAELLELQHRGRPVFVRTS